MKRKTYIELLRIVAVFFVIYNHYRGYGLFQYTSGIKQIFYLSISMLTRINVPVFLMISGAVLLGRQESYLEVLKHRVLRICLVITIFGGGLYWMYYLKALRSGAIIYSPVEEFIREVFAGTIEPAFSYWYLYAYFSFLLVLPMLQRVAKDMNFQDVIVLVGFHFLFATFLPIVKIFTNLVSIDPIALSPFFIVPLATEKCFFYPLIGYYIENKVNLRDICQKKLRWISLLGFVIGISVPTWCTIYVGSIKAEYSENYVQVFDYLLAIIVFIAVKNLTCNRYPQLFRGGLAKAIELIGSLTFGIYLIDPYLKAFFYSKYETLVESFLPTIIISIGWVVLSMLIGGLITYMLKKLPVLKRLL